MFSAWRMVTIVLHQAGWSPNMDFTFYAPNSIILSAAEVATAAIAASMPICWPHLRMRFQAIFVTQVIEITTHRRDDEDEVELERSDGDSGRESQQGLRRKGSSTTMDFYYNDHYVAEQVDPLKGGGEVSVSQCQRTIRD